MHTVINQISSILLEVTQQHWPEERITPVVMPHYDLNLGDLYSALCLELSARLKMPLDSIAKKFIDRFDQHKDFNCRYREGFLNFEITQTALRVDLADTFTNAPVRKQSYDITISPVLQSLQCCSHLRICAAALLQSFLLQRIGAEVALWVGEQEINLASDLSEIIRQLTDLQRNISSQKQIKESIEKLLKRGREVRFWGQGPYWEGHGYGSQTRAVHIFVPAHLIENIDLSIEPSDLCALNEQAIWSWLFYLAGPTLGQDLDQTVPTLESSENLLWYLNATLRRLQQYYPHEIESVFEGIPSMIKNSDRRRLLIRMSSMPELIERLADEGQMTLGISISQQFLEMINRDLSQVIKRAGFEAGHFTREEHLIFGGAKCVISDMINTLLPKH